MSGRHRAPRRLTLGEHLFWTLIITLTLMLGVVTATYITQQRDNYQHIDQPVDTPDQIGTTQPP